MVHVAMPCQMDGVKKLFSCVAFPDQQLILSDQGFFADFKHCNLLPV
jgi:hypothetical protein